MVCATSVIVFIPWTDPVGNLSWPARLCPSQQTSSVIGRGWRNRQAHDSSLSLIRIQRGICNRCPLTLTFLPFWLMPHAHYSLLARQQATTLANSPICPLEHCIPICADKDRSPDPSTVRRSLLRRTQSLWISLLGGGSLRPPCSPGIGGQQAVF